LLRHSRKKLRGERHVPPTIFIGELYGGVIGVFGGYARSQRRVKNPGAVYHERCQALTGRGKRLPARRKSSLAIAAARRCNRRRGRAKRLQTCRRRSEPG
jgi:hypothetical protein